MLMASPALSLHASLSASVLAMGGSSAARGTSRFLQCDKTHGYDARSRRRIAQVALASGSQRSYTQFPCFQTSTRASLALAWVHPSVIATERPQQRRYQHTSTATKVKTTKTTAVDKKVYDQINPPVTTRSAPLDIPSGPGDAAQITSYLKHYFAVGRAYLSFYKAGLKNVYGNFRLSAPIRRRVGLSVWFPSFPDIPPPSMARAQTTIGEPLTRERRTAGLRRAEYHLLRRSSYDLRRLIPFAFVLLICGELTPFVVLLPGVGNLVVPRICLTPRQLDKEERSFALRKDREEIVYNGAKYMDLKDSKAIRDLNAFSISPTDALNATISLNLTRHTPPQSLIPLFARLFYRRRLSKHLTYLVWDDVLLRRDGGVEALCREELRISILQRGGVEVLLQDSEEEERRWLKTWIQGV